MYSNVTKQDTFENPFFIGTVEDNKDPTLNYRVKVRIDQIHPKEITTEYLPWAAKVDASFMGMGSSAELHSIPEIGSQVLILAVGNNINSLVYLGCLYKKDNTPSGDDYINNYGIYTKQGEFIGVEKIKNVFHMIWNGDLTLDVKGKIKIGLDAIQPAALGDDLQMQIDNIISTFNSHTHLGNLGLPTATPGAQLKRTELRSKKVTIE